MIVLFLSVATFKANAQTVIEIDPLFEYPVAPEEMESLNEKCNYLVKNFWNNFDFKKKTAVDQYALNAAFQVYSTTFQYASDKDVLQSVDKLIKNLSGNQTLLMQFCKAAEENLYGMKADFWADEIYLKFLDAVIKDKKISENRKSKYIQQANVLRKSMVGNTAPSFTFTDASGESKKYFPMSTPTLLIFGDPEDTDWRLARLKMDSNFQLDEALNKGKVNILYIVPGNVKNWQNEVSNYNKYWTTGESSEAATLYDLRITPSIFLIDSGGKIVEKHLAAMQAVDMLLQLVK